MLFFFFYLSVGDCKYSVSASTRKNSGTCYNKLLQNRIATSRLQGAPIPMNNICGLVIAVRQLRLLESELPCFTMPPFLSVVNGHRKRDSIASSPSHGNRLTCLSDWAMGTKQTPLRLLLLLNYPSSRHRQS